MTESNIDVLAAKPVSYSEFVCIHFWFVYIYAPFRDQGGTGIDWYKRSV